MTEIPAALVKQLRERTGAGMMDCKRALVETDGDLEAATRLLREQGLAEAGKRAGRETSEGTVVSRVEPERGAMVAVGCETEPVSNNEEFVGFARRLLDTVSAGGPAAAEQLEDARVELVAKLGENIVVQGAQRYEASNGEVVADYVHPPAGKIGVLVLASGASPELARMVAMHVAAARPTYVGRDEVPEAEVAAERELYEKLPDVAAKPENVRPKIVDGMLAKRFFAANVLLDQDWVHDPSLTVGKALAEHGAEVKAFVRYNVGRE
ncbi:MAG: translation elongation factor Ts [Gaiellaceae bacterium]